MNIVISWKIAGCILLGIALIIFLALRYCIVPSSVPAVQSVVSSIPRNLDWLRPVQRPRARQQRASRYSEQQQQQPRPQQQQQQQQQPRPQQQQQQQQQQFPNDESEDYLEPLAEDQAESDADADPFFSSLE